MHRNPTRDNSIWIHKCSTVSCFFLFPQWPLEALQPKVRCPTRLNTGHLKSWMRSKTKPVFIPSFLQSTYKSTKKQVEEFLNNVGLPASLWNRKHSFSSLFFRDYCFFSSPTCFGSHMGGDGADWLAMHDVSSLVSSARPGPPQAPPPPLDPELGWRMPDTLTASHLHAVWPLILTPPLYWLHSGVG